MPEMTPAAEAVIPPLSEIRQCTEDLLGHRPCIWQVKAVEAILKHDQDVVCIAGTGSGKTLTFWMPLLFRENGIQIVVTPLNILGKQNTDQLAAMGIKAKFLDSKEASNPQNFKVELIHSHWLTVCHYINCSIRISKMVNTESLWPIPRCY